MSDYLQTFVTSNYTFHGSKGYVVKDNRPIPKFLTQLGTRFKQGMDALRTSNPFNLTMPTVPRTGKISEVIWG